MAGHDSERIYDVLGRLEDNINCKHTEVVQRLTRLEVMQHSPNDCPGAARVEDKINAHLKSDAIEKRDASWKGLAKEGIRVIVAAISGIGAAILAVGK